MQTRNQLHRVNHSILPSALTSQHLLQMKISQVITKLPAELKA